MKNPEPPHRYLWKRHRRKVWTSLALVLAVGWLHQERVGREAKERTWELAARLGLSTDWKQWYAHEYYPEPEDNVACHPLFEALRIPSNGGPQWDFTPLLTEATPALPTQLNLKVVSTSEPVAFSELKEILQDEQNRALAPEAVIAATKPMERITEQVLDAAKRKGRNWRLTKPTDFAVPTDMPIPALSNVFSSTTNLSALWKARAAAYLELGDRVAAGREMRALLQWGDFWNGGDSLVSGLVSIAAEGICLPQTEPLLMHPAWTAEDLASFDASLARRDLPRTVFFGLRKEANGLALTEDALFDPIASKSFASNSSSTWQNFLNFCVRHLPKSLRNQNARVASEYMSQTIGLDYDPGSGLQRPAPWAGNAGVPHRPTSIGPSNFLADIATPALSNVFSSALAAQTRINHDRVLIALRQYYLANGAYPAQLQQIKTDLPIDRVTGEPIHYHLAPDHSKLHLWSANHSGKPGDDASPPSDSEKIGWISLEIPLPQGMAARL